MTNTNLSSANYKAIIFDLDDTLVITYKVKSAQHKAVAKKHYNIDLTDEDILKHWGKPLHKLIGELYRNSDNTDNMVNAYFSMHDDYPKIAHQESPNVIDELLARGIKVGLLTSTMSAAVLADMKRLGFPIENFFIVQTAEDTNFHKPDPRVFEPALNKLANYNIKGKQIAYVGDALIDHTAAKGAGIDFIAITTGLNTTDEFKKAGASPIIGSIGKLPNLIFKNR